MYGYPYERYRPTDRIFKVVPFSSSRKKMFSIVFNDKTQNLRIYAKGASE